MHRSRAKLRPFFPVPVLGNLVMSSFLNDGVCRNQCPFATAPLSKVKLQICTVPAVRKCKPVYMCTQCSAVQCSAVHGSAVQGLCTYLQLAFQCLPSSSVALDAVQCSAVQWLIRTPDTFQCTMGNWSTDSLMAPHSLQSSRPAFVHCTVYQTALGTALHCTALHCTALHYCPRIYRTVVMTNYTEMPVF